MTRSLALFSLLTLTACTALGGGDGKDPAGDGDDTAGGDDSGDGGGGPLLGVCGAYTGYRAVGDRWTWGFTEDYVEQSGYTGQMVTEVTAVDDGGATIQVLTTAETSSDSVERYDYATATTLSCAAEGLLMTWARVDYEMDMMGSTYTGWSETTYDVPYLLVPAGLAAGDTWTAEPSGVTVSDQGTQTPFAYTQTYEATDVATVEVPAGTFQALTIDVQTDGANPTSYWIDEAVGTVLTETTELLSYER